jgi:hypothetical protein
MSNSNVVNLPEPTGSKSLPTVIPFHELLSSGFPKEAIEVCYYNFEHLWNKYNPKIFGKIMTKEYPEFEFEKFAIIPSDEFAAKYEVASASDKTVKVETQTYRSTGGNPKQPELDRCIKSQGYILSEFPALIIRRNPGDSYASCPVGTGHSRNKSLSGVPNRLVCIGKFKSGTTEDRKDYIIHTMGQFLQSENLPSSGVGTEDAIQSCLEALNKGWLKWRYDLDVDSITVAQYLRSLDPQSQSYGKDKLNDIVIQTMGRYESIKGTTNSLIKPWKSSENTTKEFITDELNLKDTTKTKLNNKAVRYITVSSNGFSKAYKMAVNTWAKDKESEVRVIVCVGSMKAGDLIGSYHEKIGDFAKEWESFVANANEAHKVGAKNCENGGKFGAVLYGALPSISQLTNMTILRYNSKTRTFFQKETGFQYCIDDLPNTYTTNK